MPSPGCAPEPFYCGCGGDQFFQLRNVEVDGVLRLIGQLHGDDLIAAIAAVRDSPSKPAKATKVVIDALIHEVDPIVRRVGRDGTAVSGESPRRSVSSTADLGATAVSVPAFIAGFEEQLTAITHTSSSFRILRSSVLQILC
jgi:hypothetical protein